MSHLEVPAELAFSMAKTDRWTPEVTERSLAKVSPSDVAVKGRRKKRNQQQVCGKTWKKIFQVRPGLDATDCSRVCR